MKPGFSLEEEKAYYRRQAGLKALVGELLNLARDNATLEAEVKAAGTVQQPAGPEPTFTLEQIEKVRVAILAQSHQGRPLRRLEFAKDVCNRLAPEPQKQVIVSGNSVLIDGAVCATFSGKDSLDAAQDYARLRIARLAELAKEAGR
jgi:hypothetical protein